MTKFTRYNTHYLIVCSFKSACKILSQHFLRRMLVGLLPETQTSTVSRFLLLLHSLFSVTLINSNTHKIINRTIQHITKLIMINTTKLHTIKINMATMSVNKNDDDYSQTSTASISSYEFADSLDDFAETFSATANIVAANKKKKRVRFGTLEVHEHAVELGGSGVPGNGPPMTIEWEEQAYYFVKSVELFENSRPFENRRGSELLQSSRQRTNMLLEAGHTLSEINKYVKQNQMIRKQRCQTIKIQQRFPVLSKVLGR